MFEVLKMKKKPQKNNKKKNNITPASGSKLIITRHRPQLLYNYALVDKLQMF